jgi:sulfide:quinone oxidoreductase
MNASRSRECHAVVVGGGFAGVAAAYTLRECLGPDKRVSVIEPSGRFVFTLSLVWAVLGRPAYHSAFALYPALDAKGIEYQRSRVLEVRADERVVRTDDGDIQYDRLIIATGGRPDPNAISGLAGEFRSAHWIVGEESALEAGETLRRVFSHPGPVVIGAAQGATYFTGAYELALALDAMLRRRGIRDRVPLTFITGQPYLGDLGLDQGAAGAKLKTLFGERDIAVRTGVTIDHVGREEVVLGSGETLPAAASVIMPPFTGDVDIWKSPDLTDEHGFIPVNDRYQHVRYPEIYAAGVACCFDRAIPPLTGPRAPHTGYLAVRMGQTAAQNVAASLGAASLTSRTLPYLVDIRILDGVDIGLLLASWGTTRLHNVAIQVPGKVAHYLKAAQEQYLLWRLRTGRMHLP